MHNKKVFMKKVMMFVLAGLFAISGCLKDNNQTPNCSPVNIVATNSEVTALKAYIDSNHIAVTQDSRGFFYSIDSSASTAMGHPTICSDISVVYTAQLLNGEIVDSTGANTPASFNLSGTIIGWQEAIPLMKSNSIITLYLPPSLAYGASGRGPVPGNANLIYTTKLLAFN